MAEENISQEFRLKNIDEARNYFIEEINQNELMSNKHKKVCTRNYFIEEINQNELMSNKHKKVCTAFNYLVYFLILASTITGCISISVFYSLIGIPIGTASSAIGLRTFAIAAGIERYKSIIKKKKKSMIKYYASKI